MLKLLKKLVEIKFDELFIWFDFIRRPSRWYHRRHRLSRH